MYSQPEIRHAYEWAQNYGVKGLIYGPSGVGKTPIPASTAPRPLLLLHETGTGSLRKCNAPTVAAFTVQEAENFYEWFDLSNEANNYDTLIVDSVAQLCEMYLDKGFSGGSKSGNDAHGMKVYGDMAKAVNKIVTKLYYRRFKHILLITKQEILSLGGVETRRPYFPGKVLPIDIPHLMDNIFHQGYYNVPGRGETLAVRCKGTYDTIARDRFGNLAELEPPDYGAIIQKCMQ